MIDFRKTLMEILHAEMGIAINGVGIKSLLKVILREIYEIEIYTYADISEYLMKVIMHVISRYRNRETMLFANNKDFTIPGDKQWNDSSGN